MSRQNVYDDPTFFAGYRNLRDNLVGLHENVIQPALPRLLPDDLSGKNILDVGCGEGFCEVALKAGAASVVGVDPSSRMLGRARQNIRAERAAFVETFAEDARFPAGSFDFVVSILALHYVADYRAVIESVALWLTQGGVLVMMIEHPVATCQRDLEWIGQGDDEAWPVMRYHDEGMRAEHWYIDGVVKYHRTIETTVNTIIAAGLTVQSVIEPVPTRDAVACAGRSASGLIRPDVLGVRAIRC